MMKKTYLILVLILSFNYLGQAKNIVDYFVDMPSYLIPTFGSSFRLELSENYLNGTKDSLENTNGKLVYVNKMDTTNNYLSIQITPNSRLEMKLFTGKQDTIIGVINTVCAPICSSYISFYNTKWNNSKILFPNLSAKNWLKDSNELINETNIQNFFPASFIEYTFSINTENIIAKNNSIEFVSKSDRDSLIPYLIEEDIVLVRNGNKFEATKNIN